MNVADQWLCSNGSSLNVVSAGGGGAGVVFGATDELDREPSIFPPMSTKKSYPAGSIHYVYWNYMQL